jgi:hypothetical protein
MIRTTSDFDVPSSNSTVTMQTDVSSSQTDASSDGLPPIAAVPASDGGNPADRSDRGDPAGNTNAKDTSQDDDEDFWDDMDEETLMEHLKRIQKRIRTVREDRTSQASSGSKRSTKRSKSLRPNLGKVIVNDEVIAEPLKNVLRGDPDTHTQIPRTVPESAFISASENESPVINRDRASNTLPRVDPGLIRQSEQAPIPSTPSTPVGPEVILTEGQQMFTPKASEHRGETGSSGNNIIEVDADKVTHTSSTFVEDLMVGMAMRYRNELIESEQKAKESMHADLSKAALTAIEREAWTAQQTVLQLEASANLAEQRLQEQKMRIESEAREYAERQKQELNSITQQARSNHDMHVQNMHRTKLAEATLASNAEMHIERLRNEARAAQEEKKAQEAEMVKTNQLVRELREKIAHLTSASSQETPQHLHAQADDAIIQDIYNQLNAEKILADRRAADAQEKTKILIESATTKIEERTKNQLSHLEKMMAQMMETMNRAQNTQTAPVIEREIPKINARGRSPTARPSSNNAKTGVSSTLDHIFKRNAGSSTVTITQTKTEEPAVKPIIFESGGGDPDDDPDDDNDSSDEGDRKEPPKKDNEKDKDQRKEPPKKENEKDKEKKKKPKGNDDPDDGGDDDNDDDDDPERQMKKIISALKKKRGQKEADSIKLLSLPEPAQFRAWRQATRNKVVAASSDPEKAYKWIKAVEETGAKLEDFRDSGDFTTLDSKLGSAITDIAKGDLGRKITLTTEKEDKLGNLTKGRQLLRVVYDHFRIDEFAGVLYSLTDLITVRMKGDSHSARQLELFINTWDHTLAGMKHEPTDDVLEALFIERVRNCHPLAQDIGIYDRAREGQPERSYAFLYEAATRFIERRRRKENRDAIQKALTNASNGRVPAAPVADRAKGKTKGKYRSRSPSAGRKGKGGRPPSQGRKNICFAWKNIGKCERHEAGNCKYDHPPGSRRQSESPGWTKVKPRSGSKGRKGKGKGKYRSASRKSIPCMYFQKGNCKAGDNCNFSHDDAPAAPAKGGGKGGKRPDSRGAGKRKGDGKKKNGSEQDFQ